MEKVPPRRMTVETRRDIEMMLWGAVAFTADKEVITAAITPDLVSQETWKLFEELTTQRKKKSLSADLKDWLAQHAVTIKQGDDLLSAIVRALESERDVEMIQNMSKPLEVAMKYGDRDRVVTLLKNVLVQLGEIKPTNSKEASDE
jgi:hypothetical protein